MTGDDDREGPAELPIDGTLDLHTFRPRDVRELVPDYLAACRERGILQVRIVHGKGIGALRRTVHSLLGRLPEVAGFESGGAQGGGWGATVVTLRPPGPGVPRAGTSPGQGLDLELLEGEMAICRLAPDDAVPAWAAGGPFLSISRSPDELSIVCAAARVPAGVCCEGGYCGLRVAGKLDFGLTGVLASLATPLAEAGIAILAVSTYDTDYLLVPRDRLDDARGCLVRAGHRFVKG